jgi:hypothetical protein
MFQLVRNLSDSPGSCVTRALLLGALLIPCTTVCITSSLFSIAAEAEVSFEDLDECWSVSQTSRRNQMRIRSGGGSLMRAVDFEHPARVGHWATAHFLSGHRLANGLLAPLRC